MSSTLNKKKVNKVRPKFEREEIVELIVCDLLNGLSRYKILLKLDRDSYEGYNTSVFSRSKKYELVSEAYEKCKIPLAEDRQKQRELFIARYEDILEECRDQRDRQNAIATLKEMGKLLGLYEPEKVDITGNMNVEISFGLETDNNEG